MDKNSKISLVVMTGNSWRHRYLANRLGENFNVLRIISEEKRALKAGKTLKEDEVIDRHSKERDETEKIFFDGEKSFDLSPEKIMTLNYGEINSQKIFKTIVDLNPDLIILFGTTIVKDPLLSNFEDRIINMHLGLSPYYRGSATNFWPLVFKQPECVGTTVHLAILKVDAGPILGQARPDIKPDDDIHKIGFRAVISGVDLLISSIRDYSGGRIKPQAQDLKSGRVFKHRDFNAFAVMQAWKNFRQGMIVEYLKDKERRDKLYPIYENDFLIH